MTILGDVLAALRGALLTVPLLANGGELRLVAWEGRLFEPPRATDGTPQLFLREFLLPAGRRSASLGPHGLVRQLGLYQVDIVGSPGQGVRAMHDAAEAVLAAFPPGMAVQAGTLTVRCWRAQLSGMRSDADWLVLPVRVEWSTDAVNVI